MSKNRIIMNRRKFLSAFTTFFTGSLLGLSGVPRAFAFDNQDDLPKIAIIIDDIGYSRSRLYRFLETGVPMTFAILPRLSYSCPLAEEIHKMGHEIMLHQPMEPFDQSIDPGPGALYVGDETKKIIRIIGENVSDIPYINGINNHMGSRFTASGKEMKEALEIMKEKGLFFVDSLTTSRSTAYKTAKRLGMGTACRNFFLDYSPEKTEILLQLKKLKLHAERFGHAIGIGHPYHETAWAIDRFFSNINKRSVSLVHISNLIAT